MTLSFACSRVVHFSSFSCSYFKLRNTRSVGLLSQRLPWRLMLGCMFMTLKCARYSALAYGLPRSEWCAAALRRACAAKTPSAAPSHTAMPAGGRPWPSRRLASRTRPRRWPRTASLPASTHRRCRPSRLDLGPPRRTAGPAGAVGGRALLCLAGKMPPPLEELRAQAQHQPPDGNPRLSRTTAQKIANRFLHRTEAKQRG